MNPRSFILPNIFNQFLSDLEINFAEQKNIAANIKRLSDIYTQKKFLNIWQDKSLREAYMCYYFPLNFLRSSSVLNELKTLNFQTEYDQIIDFGSGSGAASLALRSHGYKAKSWYSIDNCTEALDTQKSLLNEETIFQQHMPELKEDSLVICSYSLNELKNTPEWITKAKALIIIEPSTHPDSHKLIKLRSKLIENQRFAWAPCPHQKTCPMSTSRNDFCHDRIFVELPEWFLKIEEQLPMKNRSLTFSYLVTHKNKPKHKDLGRTIGDTLKEKGKTRQLVCFNSERLFLSWLKKNGEAPYLPHGQLIRIPKYEQKGNEIRVSPNPEAFALDKPDDA